MQLQQLMKMLSMIDQLLKGKGLIAFSDPGGAKACLAVGEKLTGEEVILVSDRQYPFFSDFSVNVIPSQDNIEHLFSHQIDYVYTGTSSPERIELKILKEARKRKITSFSFVDHWTNMRKRFIDSSGDLILPDKVCVIDKRAKTIAINDGIDKNIIVITGNPYHEWLLTWKPKISRLEFLENVGLIGNSHKLVVFAPDPISNVNGKDAYGFDEYSATKILTALFDTYKTELAEWNVLIKSHPNQNNEKLYEMIQHNKSFVFLPSEIDTNSLIYYSDIIIGFFSSFLIEASILNKTILRLLPDNLIKDPIAPLNIGKIVNKNQLLEELIK